MHSFNEEGSSLLKVLDHSITPMGTRLLRRWILMPLKDKHAIEVRLDTVEHLIKDPELSKNIGNSLKAIGDLERIISKVSMQKINPREVIQLNRALHALTDLKSYLLKTDNPNLQK